MEREDGRCIIVVYQQQVIDCLLIFNSTFQDLVVRASLQLCNKSFRVHVCVKAGCIGILVYLLFEKDGVSVISKCLRKEQK
jgi:hypothetical protein